jgi:hypothetical protein
MIPMCGFRTGFKLILLAFESLIGQEGRTMGSVFTSFLDGFALAGLTTRLRRPGAPTRAFAPSKPKDKMVIVVDDDLAVEKLEGLRHETPGFIGASYSLVEAQVYIRNHCKVS